MTARRQIDFFQASRHGTEAIGRLRMRAGVVLQKQRVSVKECHVRILPLLAWCANALPRKKDGLGEIRDLIRQEGL